MSVFMMCCVCLFAKKWKRFYWNCVCSVWKNSKVLYHSTDHESARKIVESGFFLRGSPQCMFGSGIYFAESPEIATFKAWYRRKGAVIEAEVALGRCYQPKSPEKDLTYTKLQSMGYDSVWARPKPDGPMGTSQEWVVYNMNQVRLLSVKVDGKDLLGKRATQGGLLLKSEREQATQGGMLSESERGQPAPDRSSRRAAVYGRAELLANRAALGMWSGVGCNLSAVTAGF